MDKLIPIGVLDNINAVSAFHIDLEVNTVDMYPHAALVADEPLVGFRCDFRCFSLYWVGRPLVSKFL